MSQVIVNRETSSSSAAVDRPEDLGRDFRALTEEMLRLLASRWNARPDDYDRSLRLSNHVEAITGLLRVLWLLVRVLAVFAWVVFWEEMRPTVMSWCFFLGVCWRLVRQLIRPRNRDAGVLFGFVRRNRGGWPDCLRNWLG